MNDKFGMEFMPVQCMLSLQQIRDLSKCSHFTGKSNFTGGLRVLDLTIHSVVRKHIAKHYIIFINDFINESYYWV